MDQIQTIILTALPTIAVAVIGTYVVVAATRQKKRLGYEVEFARRVVNLRPGAQASIRISVPAALIRDNVNAEDMLEEWVEVDSVFGFRIRVHNSGSQVIDNQRVLFRLDDEAIIVAIHVGLDDPGFADRVPCITGFGSNQGEVFIRFLNEGEAIAVDVTSIDNSTNDCVVAAPAPGLKAFDMSARRRVFVFAGIMLGSIFAFTGVSALLAAQSLNGFSLAESPILFIVSVVSTGFAYLALASSIVVRSVSSRQGRSNILFKPRRRDE